MVYCQRCGAKNEEKAEYCTKCGSALYLTEKGERREETCFNKPERHVEEECFRIPYGGAIAGIIVGIFIILLGLALASGLDIWRWIGPFIAIVIGLLIIIGVALGRYRR